MPDVDRSDFFQEMLHALHEVTSALCSAVDLQTGAERLLEIICSMPGLDCGGLYLWNDAGTALELRFHRGLSAEFVKDVSSIPMSSHRTEIILKGEPFYGTYPSNIPWGHELGMKEGLRAIALFPLKYEGRVIGALNLGSHSVDQILPQTRRTLEAIASNTGIFLSFLRSQEEIRRWGEFEHMLAEVASRFINVPAYQMDAEITSALASLGRILKMDRGYVFRFSSDGLRMSNTHEWCAEGIVSHMHELQELCVADYKLTERMRDSGEAVHISRVMDISDEFKIDREEFLREGIKSIIFMPMIFAGVTLGFVGFDAVRAERNWSQGEIERLGLIAEIFVTAFQRQREEQEKSAMQDHLRQLQKLESLGLMAAGVAHDLNNLLVGILGNTSLALAELNPNTPAYDRVLDIQRAAQSSAGLASQMLSYAGDKSSVFEAINMRCVVQDTISLVQSGSRGGGVIDWHVDLDAGDMMVLGDSAQLQQVVMNLLVNAVEALGAGGGRISVALGSGVCDRNEGGAVFLGENLLGKQSVILEVSDSGCGMDAKTVERIFDPFFTTKMKGRGLGLATVFGIVRSHGGGVLVRSRPGEGTVMRVLLPLKQNCVSKTERDKEKEWRGSGAVLLVDDEALVLQVSSAMLERLGFRVISVSTEAEALDIVRRHDCELRLAILDLMPSASYSGVNLFNKIKELAPGLPVIVCSGLSRSLLEDRMSLPEDVIFLQKPFTLQQLTESVERLLG